MIQGHEKNNLTETITWSNPTTTGKQSQTCKCCGGSGKWYNNDWKITWNCPSVWTYTWS